MSKSKEIMKQKLDNMTDEEINSEFQVYVNIEFSINKDKFIFKNVKESFLKDFSRATFIKVLTLEIDWFNYASYDSIEILGENFLITESSRNKVVLVQGNL